MTEDLNPESEKVFIEVDREVLNAFKEEFRRKQKEIEVRKEIEKMTSEMRSMTKAQMIEKYKNPSKVYAELQGRLKLAKLGFSSWKEYYDARRERFKNSKDVRG